jgi:hypothetical protein
MRQCRCGSENVFIRELSTGKWFCLDCACEEGCPDALSVRAMQFALEVTQPVGLASELVS